MKPLINKKLEDKILSIKNDIDKSILSREKADHELTKFKIMRQEVSLKIESMNENDKLMQEKEIEKMMIKMNDTMKFLENQFHKNMTIAQNNILTDFDQKIAKLAIDVVEDYININKHKNTVNHVDINMKNISESTKKIIIH